jgi:hypothetical protein
MTSDDPDGPGVARGRVTAGTCPVRVDGDGEVVPRRVCGGPGGVRLSERER